MNKNDFTYNYLFEELKETSVFCHEAFKKRFKAKYPNVKIDLRSLIIEIEKYQVNKYGTIKFSDYYIEKPSYIEKKHAKISKAREIIKRFGTKKERKEREMDKKKVSNNE